MSYYITVEVRTKKELSRDQQDKLRDAVLRVLDEAELPYVYDIPTARVEVV